MTVDEIIKISHAASRGAAAVTSAHAECHPATRAWPMDPSDLPLADASDDNPDKIQRPADLSSDEMVAWEFGAGHAFGVMLHMRRSEGPGYRPEDLASDAEGSSFKRGVTTGMEQGAGVSEASNRYYDRMEAGDGEDEDDSIHLADNEDDAPEDDAPASEEAELVTNSDGATKEKVTFDGITGGATDAGAVESGDAAPAS